MSILVRTVEQTDSSKHMADAPIMFETLEPRILMSATPTILPAAPVIIASSIHPAIVQEANGAKLSVSLVGQGSWQITQDSSGNLQLNVANTTTSSKLTLTTTNAPGGAHFLLNAIDLQGPIGLVSGTGVDIRGKVTAEGAISHLALGNVLSNSSITLSSASPISEIDLGNVTDLSLTTKGSIGVLSVGNWIADGVASSQVTATAIGDLQSAGNFGASLALSGTGVLPSGGFTLGSVSVEGQLSGLWYVVGNTNVISAGTITQQWDGDFTKSVQTIITGGDFDGQLATPFLNDMIVGGNVSHALLLIGADLGADGEIGGSGANADTFGPGEFNGMEVGGSVTATRIRIGVDPVDGVLDDGTNTLLGGSFNNVFVIGQSLDTASSFVAGAFPIAVVVNGQLINTATNSDFHTTPINLVPLSLTASLAHDTGSSATDGLTNDDTITGQATGGVVTLLGSIDSKPVGSGLNLLTAVNPGGAKAVAADGTFTLTPALLATIAGGTLADGSHTLHLLATDKFGNTKTLNITFTLDTAVPVLTASLASDTGVSASDGITSNDTITGKVTDGTSIATLSAGFDGAAASSFTNITNQITAGGTFTLTPALLATIAGGTLANGAHVLHLTATDTVGNVTSLAVSFTVATVAPSLTAALANDTGVSASDGITSDDTIAGKVTAITDALTTLSAGFDGAASSSFTNITNQITAGGTFTLTPALLASIAGGTLANGAHVLHLTATDQAGNVTSLAVSFTVATTAPSLTASLKNDTGASASDGITGDDTITGKATAVTDALATLSAGFDGASASSFVNLTSSLNPDGTFTLTPAQLASIAGGALAAGSHTLHLTATDQAGNATSFAVTFTLDTAAPVLTASLKNDTGVSASDGITSDDTITGKVTAITDALTTLSAGFDGAAPSSFTNITNQITAGGMFTLTPALLASIAGGTLANGAHVLHLTATDQAGNLTSFAVSFTVATAAPSLTAALKNDTGASASDGITSDDTITGKATAVTDALATLSAGFDGASASSFVNLTSSLNPDGTFTLTPAQLASIAGGTLADGTHTLHLTATDQAGNTTSFAVTFTLDTAVPVLTAALANDTGVSASDGITSDDTIAGKATGVNSIVKLSAGFDGAASSTFTTITNQINTNGTFTLTPALLATIAGGTLADGAHVLHLAATDQAGNVTSLAVSFTVATTAPSLTAALKNDTGASDGITGDDTITGKATAVTDALATLSAGFDGASASSFVNLTSSLNPDGSFTLTPAQLATIAGGTLADGTHTLHLTATDQAGNATTFAVTLTLDTAAPVLTASLANDTGVSASDGITSDDTIAGKATGANGIVKLSAGFDGAAASSFTNITNQINTNGTFTLTPALLATIAGGTLADGAHVLHLTATDQAGNVTSLAVSFTVATTAPSLTAALKNGTGASDGITSDDTITGRATAVTDALATLSAGFDGASASSFVNLTSSLNPDGTFTLTPAQLATVAGGTLADGVHTLHLTATDQAGNATTFAVTFTLDTAAPSLTASLKNDTGVSASDGITSDDTIAGKVTDIVGVTAFSAGLDGGSAVNGTNLLSMVNPDGTFTLTPALLTIIAGGPLADGPHTLHLTATDTTGNVTTLDLSFVLATATPTLSAALKNDTGASATDGITKDDTVTGTATAPADAIATLSGGFDATQSTSFVDLTSALQSGGTFVLDPTLLAKAAGGTLADGAHTLHLVATDRAGNASSFDLSFTLDTAPPLAPTIALAASDQDAALGSNVTGASSVTITGQTNANTAVSLTAPGGVSFSTISDNHGNFQFDNIGLALGANVLTAQAIDIAGNTQNFALTVERVAQPPSGNAVLQWNAAALNAIQLSALDPVTAARALAMESVAVLDSINAIDNTPSFLVHLDAPADASADAAVTAAAHEILDTLFPQLKTPLDALYQTGLDAIANGQGKTDGIALGTAIAEQVLVLRANDGSQIMGQTLDGTSAGQWRSTGPSFGLAVSSQYANVTPFALTSPSELLSTVPPPPDLATAAYATDVNQVEALGAANSTTRTADQTAIAQFWAGQAGTVTAAGQWNQVAAEVAQQQGNSLSDDAKLLGELNVGLADAGIADWNAKYSFDFWSPVTAIQNADPSNSLLTPNANFTPLVTTPEVPEYVETQSALGAAASTILDNFFGQSISFSLTSGSATRSFTSFDQAAQEAGASGIYAGTDSQFSNAAGQNLGQKVGGLVLQAFDITKDVQPPKVVLDGPSTTVVTNTSPVITGTVIDNLSGVQSLQVSIDGGALQNVTFDQAGKFSIPLNLALDGSADGQHTVSLIATDAVGNATPPRTINVTLATKGPGVLPSLTDSAGNVLSAGSDGSTQIAAGAIVEGLVQTETGTTLAGLSYTFDAGTANAVTVPISFISPTADGASLAFNTSLDLSHLGAGAHTLTLTTTDTAGNITSTVRNVTLPALVPLTIVNLTPADGAGDIGVTVRPMIQFSRPIDMSTLTGNDFFLTDATGAKIPTIIVPWNDNMHAWLFPATAMPGGQAVTLHVDGSQIKGLADGAALDAAGTGQAGSVFTETFTTVSTTPVAGTTITGQILDPGPALLPGTSATALPIAGAHVYILGFEGVPGYDTMTGADGTFSFSNAPTGDVKVVVDGRTATNNPTGVQFPVLVVDLDVKAGQDNTIAGSRGSTESQLANATNQELFLPRIMSDVMTTLSQTAPTVLQTTADSSPMLTPEQLSQLSLTVQPGSLVDEHGQPLNAQVGFSAVPSDTIKDMLPVGLAQHSFDITIQTNVPELASFTTPAALTLPNVFNLKPGSKTYLLTFDYTTGRLEIDGTCTVSADGKTVSTDPGQGVTKIGWHSMTPQGAPIDNSLKPSGETSNPKDCSILQVAEDSFATAAKDVLKILASLGGQISDIAKAWADIVTLGQDAYKLENSWVDFNNKRDNGTASLSDQAAFVKNFSAAVGDFLSICTNAAGKLTPEIAAVKNGLQIAGAAADLLDTLFTNLNKNNCLPSGPIATPIVAGIQEALDTLNSLLKIGNDVITGIEKGLPTFIAKIVSDELGGLLAQIKNFTPKPPKTGPALLQFAATTLLVPADPLSDDEAVVAGVEADIVSVATAQGDTDLLGTNNTPAPADPLTLDQMTAEIPDAMQAQSDLQAQIDQISSTGAQLPSAAALGGTLAQFRDLALGSAPNAPYAFFLADGTVFRGRSDANGAIDAFLPLNMNYTFAIIDTRFNEVQVGTVAGNTASGTLADPQYVNLADVGGITDVDGLPDLVVQVLGLDPSKVDNIVPGVTDLAALTEGLDQTNASVANVTGIVASVPLNGTAQAVALAGSNDSGNQQTAYIAAGSGGLAIVDVTNPRNPLLLSQIALGGNAVGVAVDAGIEIAAVATGTGLQLLNVDSGIAPSLLHTVAINATDVKVIDGIAYASVGSKLVSVDLVSGRILSSQDTGAPITGLTVDGATLYATSSATGGETLSIIDASKSDGTMALESSTFVPVSSDNTLSGPITSPSGKLSVSDGVAYLAQDPLGVAVTGMGFVALDVSNPKAPKVISLNNSEEGLAAGDVALTGTGLGISIGTGIKTVGSETTTPDLLDVLNTLNPLQIGALNSFLLPSAALDVATDNGFAFVADSSGGLQIVNYLTPNTSGVGPVVTVLSGPTTGMNPSLLDPATPVNLPEGSAVSFQLDVKDASAVPAQVELIATDADGNVHVLAKSSTSFEAIGATLPTLAELESTGSGRLSLQISVADTSGNITLSTPINVDLVSDTTLPVLVDQSIPDQSTIATITSPVFTFDFSKPLSPSSVNVANFELIGPDGTTVIPPSAFILRNDNQTVEVAFNALPPGNYQFQINAPAVTDIVGNALGTAVLTTHVTVASPVLSQSIPDQSTISSTAPAVFTFNFLVPLDPSTVNNINFSLNQSGGNPALVPQSLTLSPDGKTVSATFSSLAPGQYQFQIHASGVNGVKDTFGDSLGSSILTTNVTVVAPVALVSQSVADQAVFGPGSAPVFTFNFSAPLDPNTVTASTFALLAPDNTMVTPQSFILSNNNQTVSVAFGPLANGSYQFQVNAPAIKDIFGNALGTTILTTHVAVAATQPVATWVGATGNSDWNDAANWSIGRVPSAGDDVVMTLQPGQVVVMSSGSDSIKSLTEQGGGTLLVAGSVTVTGDARIAGSLVLDSGTVTVNGAATVTNVQIGTGPGESQQIGSGDGGGSFIVNGPATVTNLDMPEESLLSLPGLHAITFTANGPATVVNLTQFGGNINAPGALTLTGTSTVSTSPSGFVTGTVTTIIPSGLNSGEIINNGTLRVSGSDSVVFTLGAGAVLVNNGQMTMRPESQIDLGQNGTLTNAATGTLTMGGSVDGSGLGTANILGVAPGDGGMGLLNNQGTIVIPAGSAGTEIPDDVGSAFIAVAMNNSGVVQLAPSTTLTLTAGSTISGQIVGNGTVNFEGNAFFTGLHPSTDNGVPLNKYSYDFTATSELNVPTATISASATIGGSVSVANLTLGQITFNPNAGPFGNIELLAGSKLVSTTVLMSFTNLTVDPATAALPGGIFQVGTLQMRDGTAVTGDDGGVVSSLSGAVQIAALIVNSGEIIAVPGDQIGSVTVQAWTSPNPDPEGTLNVALGGDLKVQGNLTVGALTLDGRVNPAGFGPKGGDETGTIVGGVVDLSLGSLSVTGNASVYNGYFVGAGTAVIGGNLTIDGSGTVNTDTTATNPAGRLGANITPGLGLDNGVVLELKGTTTWIGGDINLNYLGDSSAGTLRIDTGAEFDVVLDSAASATNTFGSQGVAFGDDGGEGRILAGAIKISGHPDPVYIPTANTTASFDNKGLFRKISGAGTTVVTVPFNNSGTVEVDQGTLTFDSATVEHGIPSDGTFTNTGALLLASAGSIIENVPNAPNQLIFQVAAGLTQLTVDFTAPVNPSTVKASAFSVRESDGTIITATAIAFSSDDRSVQLTFPTISPGQVTLRLDPSGVKAQAGTAFGPSVLSAPLSLNHLTFQITSGPTPDLAPLPILAGSAVNFGINVTGTGANVVDAQLVAIAPNGTTTVLATNTASPFGLSGNLPTIAANGGASQLTLQIRVTDAFGITRLSDPINLLLVPTLQIASQSVHSGDTISATNPLVTFTFTAPVDPATVTANSFFLLAADGVTTIAPTAIQFGNNNQAVQLTFPTPAAGQYNLQVDATRVKDQFGNALGTAVLSTPFTVPGSVTDTFIGASGGEWNNPANWSTGQVPGAANDVVLNSTVNFDGATATIHSLTISNGSSFNLNSGSLTVLGATTATGAIIVNNGATVAFQSAAAVGTLTQNAGTTSLAQPSPLGVVTQTGGTLEVDGNPAFGSTTITTLSQSGGLFTGAGTVSVTGTTILTGGAMSGSGTTIAKAGLTVNSQIGSSINGVKGSYNLQRILENQGAATWSGGNIDLGGSGSNPALGTLRNDAGATFTIGFNGGTISASNAAASGLATPLIINQGTFTAGFGDATRLAVGIANTGTLQINGTLALSGTAVLGGVVSLNAAGVLNAGGNLTFDPSTVLEIGLGVQTGGGGINQVGQILVGGTLTLAGTLMTVPTANFAPATGNSLVFASFAALSGSFQSVQAAGVLAPGFALALDTKDATDLKLDVHGPLTIVSQSVHNGDDRVSATPVFDFTFNSAIDPTTVTPLSIYLLAADGTKVSALGFGFDNGDKIVTVDFLQLAPGQYRLEIDASKIKDQFGDVLGTGLVTTTFTVPASFTTTFIGPNGGEWNTAANWSTGEVPGITDDVVINNTVNFDGATGLVNAVGIHSLTVNAGSTLNLNSGTLGVNGLTNGPGAIVNNGASVSFGGAAAIGTLTQNAGMTLVNQSSQLGAVTLTGGTLEIDGGSTIVGIAQPSSIATLTQSGGTLQGASTVTVTGATILTGGLMFGNGTTVTQGGLTINPGSVDGTGTFHLQRVLENKGVATWSSGNIDLGGSGPNPLIGVLVNDSTGTFTIGFTGGTISASNISKAASQLTRPIINLGTIVQNAGIHTTIAVGINNSGALQINGTLDLSDPTTQNDAVLIGGTVSVGALGVLRSGTSMSFDSTTVLTNNGVIEVDQGPLSFAGPFTDNGNIVLGAQATVLVQGIPAPLGNLNFTIASGLTPQSTPTPIFEGSPVNFGVAVSDPGSTVVNAQLVAIAPDGTTTVLATNIASPFGLSGNLPTIAANGGSSQLTLEIRVTDARGVTRLSAPINLIFAASLPDIWIGAASGDNNWNDPANWSTGQVPGALNDVVMNLLPGQTVTMGSGNETINSLTEQGGGTLVVNGALTVTGATNIADTLKVVGGSFTANGAATVANLDVGDGTAGIASGNFIANGAVTLGGVDLTGGVLSVPGSVTITGQAAFNSGAEIDGPGTVVYQGTQLALTNGTILHTVLENRGQAAVSGSIDLGQSGILRNASTGTLALSGSITGIAPGVGSPSAALFDNQGSVVVSAGNTVNIGVAMSDSGQIQTSAGTVLTLMGGGTVSGQVGGAGTLALLWNSVANTYEFTATATSSVSTLTVGSVVTFDPSATFGTQNVQLKGGTLTGLASGTTLASLTVDSGASEIDGNLTIGMLSLNGTAGSAILTSAGTLIVTNSASVFDGIFLGAGTTIINADLSIAGSAPGSMPALHGLGIDGGHVLELLSGTTTWSSGDINLNPFADQTAGTLRIDLNDTFNVMFDSSAVGNGGRILEASIVNGSFVATANPTALLDVEGAFQKLGGAGTTIISDIPIDVSGTINAVQGSLEFDDTTITNRGMIEAAQGSLTFAASSGTIGSLTNASGGTIEVDQGQLSVLGTFTNNGSIVLGPQATALVNGDTTLGDLNFTIDSGPTPQPTPTPVVEGAPLDFSLTVSDAASATVTQAELVVLLPDGTTSILDTEDPSDGLEGALFPSEATQDASGNLFATLQIRVTDSRGVTRLSAPINVQLVAPSGGGKPPGDG
jgi:hypothetical protein